VYVIEKVVQPAVVVHSCHRCLIFTCDRMWLRGRPTSCANETFFFITNMFLGIFHLPVFIQKHYPVYFSNHNVSETGFCFHLQVKPNPLGPTDRASTYLRTWTSFFDWPQLSRFYLKMEKESSLRNVAFFKNKQEFG
jgi:hypothetical protein